ncbi:MAG: hypothetical protein ACLTCI_09870 [[Clostridium] nexile]
MGSGEAYPVEEIVEHELIPYKVEGNRITGMLDNADYHFGLICSNIPAEVFEQEESHMEILSRFEFCKEERKPRYLRIMFRFVVRLDM